MGWGRNDETQAIDITVDDEKIEQLTRLAERLEEAQKGLAEASLAMGAATRKANRTIRNMADLMKQAEVAAARLSRTKRG